MLWVVSGGMVAVAVFAGWLIEHWYSKPRKVKPDWTFILTVNAPLFVAFELVLILMIFWKP